MNVAGFPAQQRTIVWIAIAVIGLVGLAFIFWWLSQEPTLTAPSIKAVITKEQAEAQIKTYSNLIEENIVLPLTKNEAKSQIEAAQEIEGVFSGGSNNNTPTTGSSGENTSGIIPPTRTESKNQIDEAQRILEELGL